MPKRHQQRPAREVHGRNNPKKSTVITTGSHKKKETYEEQAREHENPNNFAGANYSPRSESQDVGMRASDIKELHGKLADLTDDELRDIVIVPLGERLEQGAKYIDLQHLELGEFVATADMLSDEDHYYVPKKHTDYVLWNRLNQVDNPARLDESETSGG